MQSATQPLTDDEWAAATSWIGTSITREEFEARYNRLGSVDQAIIETITYIISKMNGQPGSFSLPSGLSVTTSENLRAWQSILASFQSRGGLGGAGGTKIYQRVREDLR